jgi:hypothetical protein
LKKNQINLFFLKSQKHINLFLKKKKIEKKITKKKKKFTCFLKLILIIEISKFNNIITKINKTAIAPT